MKGLSCTGVACPLATPLATGVSGLQGTTVLGPPLGINAGLSVRLSPPAEPLAIGVKSNERRWASFTLSIFNSISDVNFRNNDGRSAAPVSVGELKDVGEPGTGISNAHRKPLTDSRTFWLSRGKF